MQITVSVLWAEIKIYSRIVDETKPGSFGHITLLKWLCAIIIDVIRNEILTEKRSDGSTSDGNDFFIILTWFSLLVSRSLKWVPHKCKRISNLAFHFFICVSSTKSFLPVWSFLEVFPEATLHRLLSCRSAAERVWKRTFQNGGDRWRLFLLAFTTHFRTLESFCSLKF